MLLHEVCQITGLTKKAIEYYISQGLSNPETLENGYRNFTEHDVEFLKKISVYRKLGLGIEEIRSVLADETGGVLQKLAVQKNLDLQREQTKQAVLDRLISGTGTAETEAALNAIEQNKTVTDKLLDAFPGYYGRFLCLYFARFLNEPITTTQQQSAYDEILKFLDDAVTLSFPEEVQNYLDESTRTVNTEAILKMTEQSEKLVENPEQYLAENKETLDWYLNYKKSDEYKNSPAFKMQEMLKEFNQTSGYYHVFLPAMKKLSDSYAKYFQQMETANHKFLTKYPEYADFEE